MKKCIICGTPVINKDYFFCEDCFFEIINQFEQKKYNYHTEHDLITHYYNIFCKAKQKNFSIDRDKYIAKMIALAIIQYKRYHNKDILQNKIYKDITTLKKEKTQEIKQIFEEDFIYKHFNLVPCKEKRFIAIDGHIVRSENEQKIDNMLYNAHIPHAYEKQIDEITEKNLYCDWYIPVIGDTGIYIELWGNFSNKEKQYNYEVNKKEKIKLYIKHKLKFIEFNSTEYPDDQQLQIELMKKINEKISEIFNEEQIELKEHTDSYFKFKIEKRTNKN